jgi:hypothetical protein
MGRLTCAHGLPVAEPRSTVGCAGIVVVVGGTEVVVLVDSTVVVVGSIAVVVVVGCTDVVVVDATVVVVVTGAHSVWHARHVFLIPACVGTSINGQSPGLAGG